MTKPAPKLLVIALDGADGDLILEWANEGHLPNFQRARQQSLHGRTRNPPGLYVGAVWPSFFTGMSPTRHGRYCYEQILPGSYERHHFLAKHLKTPPFWEALSRAGRRVAVVDVPKSPLTRGINGIQLCDWGTHDPVRGARFETEPAELAREIVAAYGEDPVGPCDRIGRTEEALMSFRKGLIDRVQTRARLCGELLDRESWDLFLTVFTESHCVGHQLWHVHDPTHPQHDPELARSMGDPLRDVYAAIDTAIGSLLERAGPDTTVVLLSSHGMGPHGSDPALDRILLRWEGWEPGRLRRRLARRAGRIWDDAPAWATSPLSGPVSLLRRDIALRRGRPRTPLRRSLLMPPLSDRKLFAVPNNDIFGAIQLNLVGREPRGRVQPGAECDALFRQLRRDLLELVNVDTGTPVIRDVVHTADLYPGEDVSSLPDILVEWSRKEPLGRCRSEKLGEFPSRHASPRTGDHRPAGLFFAFGPGIEPGELSATPSIMDFAATAGALLDVSLPGIDGVPIAGVQGVSSAGGSTRSPSADDGTSR